MICIEITDSGERRRLYGGFYVRGLPNGTVVRCHNVKAQGICDGETTWSLGSLEGYPEAKRITLAEYEETLTPPDPDPELTAEEAMNVMMGGSYETQ